MVQAKVDTKMDCGSDVPLCGMLVLISGLGSGEYKQPKPGVHGLWPETGSYGTSQCIPPKSKANPTKVYNCYANDAGGLLGFEIHEWEKHGSCAGVQDAEDFFTQVCGMADKPLSVMAKVKSSRGNFQAVSQALR